MDGEVLVLVEVEEVLDPALMQAYQSEARVQMTERGGRVLARGGRFVEGRPGGMFLVQRWPTEAAFFDWQTSVEYQPLLARRNAAARLTINVVPLV